jgi:glycerol-3-phosphate dehydrogenase
VKYVTLLQKKKQNKKHQGVFYARMLPVVKVVQQVLIRLLLYGLSDMPASVEELETANELGINFYTRFTPKEYLAENGKVTGIKGQGTYNKSEIILDADMVIEAIGLDEKKSL